MRKLSKNRKGFTVGDIAPIAVALVAVTIAISLGSQILGNIAEDQCASGYTRNATTGRCLNSTGSWVSGAGETYESNVTYNGLVSTDELSSWLPTVALVVAAAVIIGVIVTYLARRFM